MTQMKHLQRSLSDEALDAFWQVIAQHYPQAVTGDLSPDRTIRLQIAAENAVDEWIDNNVPPSAEVVTKRDAILEAQAAYLDSNHVPLKEFGCFVALSEGRAAIFECPMMADGSSERDENNPQHMNWSEVTVPEPKFMDKVNELFDTSFNWNDFPGR